MGIFDALARAQALDDTGCNIPERHKTLLLQQAQLLAGKRNVQMFPMGMRELPLPAGITRYQNSRGVFHFRPGMISREQIEALSSQGMENHFLNLGPYSKRDLRLQPGKKVFFVTEYTPDHVELRGAIGTDETIGEQVAYFEHSKEPGNSIIVEVVIDDDAMPDVLSQRLAS
jgi:hypothetical protein